MAKDSTIALTSAATQKVTVLFVTPHFGDVTNGPALYTQNLWSLFSEDKTIDFHIATSYVVLGVVAMIWGLASILLM